LQKRLPQRIQTAMNLQVPFQKKLDYTKNGTLRGSSTRINDFRIGEIHLREIGASVNEAEMRNSLLGMTFFKRLKSYEVKNDVLTLYWSK
jgi:aspartyl protease family protein